MIRFEARAICKVTLCVLAFACLPVHATQTICSFFAQAGDTTYEFEFVGFGDIAMIQVNAPRGARLGDYRIEVMDPETRRVRVVHVASAARATLPSFVLEGADDAVRLRFAAQELTGRLSCEALFGA